VLDNDYIGYGIRHFPFEWLQVTAAHEFFHAVQMGYDGREYETEPFRPYWMEMSAVWMEEMVYDNVDDYVGYLANFYDHPEWSLKTFSTEVPVEALHAYGSCVWPMYLQERFDDTTIIKRIWEECAKVPGDNAIDCPGCPGGKSATDIVLEEKGYAFEEAFREFTVWNYFTGDRARTESYYSEGEAFPQVKVGDLHYHTTYPVFSPSGPNHPENLGSNYVVFVPDAQLDTGGLRIEFNGHEGDFVVSAVGYKSYPHAPFDTSFIGVAKIYDWMAYDQVVMIPAVVTRSPDDYWIYDYQAFHDSSLTGDYIPPEEDRVLQNYPNPFVITGETDRTFFPFILSSPSRVRIDVFNLSGERIKTIRSKRDIILSREEYTDLASLRELDLFWDGRNEEGEYVSSGVYLYIFRTDRATEVKKIAVIR
ncbi:MAG: MXAN_6640 family putative metalloprotease, partial [Candidatus Zixiibacteriota bacterium]